MGRKARAERRLAIAWLTLEAGVTSIGENGVEGTMGPLQGWRSPERRMLQAAIDDSQTVVNGKVRLKLYKGNVMVVGRQSTDSLFDASIATFEDDAGAYNQADAEGFIKLNALRMRIAANKGRSPL